MNRNILLKKKTIILLGIILLGASIFRLYQVTRADTYTDETIAAFRAIGMIDYDTSPSQTTPWQWFATVPWWAHLSFHDHPLGFMYLQHWAYAVFGVGLLAIRLPAVLAGIGSVYLVYCIGKRLRDESTGLIAAALLAVQSYHVWVSRIGIQDGVVIFLLLLDILLLLWVKEKPRSWLWLGLTCGLGIITKYTTLIIFPIILLYCIINRLNVFRNRYVWTAAVLCFIVATPTWLYNLMLYRATGHFDFQISAALGQYVPQWTFRLGRIEVGGLGDRFRNFFLAFYNSNSPLFNLLSLGAIGYGLWQWVKTREKKLALLLGMNVIMYLWFFVIGSTYRFVIMIIPLIILLMAYLLAPIAQKQQKIFFVLFALLLFAEGLFTVNSFLLSTPYGHEHLAWATIREESQNYGFNQLNAVIESLLAHRVSALFGQPAYQFLSDLQTQYARTAAATGATPTAQIIVYNHNINYIGALWVFQRHLAYEGWPVMDQLAFQKYSQGTWDAYYRQQGVKQFYYVAPIRPEVLRPAYDQATGADELQAYLDAKHIVPEAITNAAGEPAFWLYRF